MVQTKPAITHSPIRIQAIGEKLLSVWRKPLITIPLPFPKRVIAPAEQKPVPQTEKKNETQRKPTVTPKAMQRHVPGVFSAIRNKSEFDKIRFVLRACEKFNSMRYTNVLHVERTKNGSRLIASDGKRMHVSEIKTKIKPGDYRPVVTKDEIRLGTTVSNVNFPNWERVVPTDTVRCGYINLDKMSAGKSESSMAARNMIINSFEKQSGERVNPDYLADLTKKVWAVCRQKEKNKALLLKDQSVQMDTYAVIMPLAS